MLYPVNSSFSSQLQSQSNSVLSLESIDTRKMSKPTRQALTDSYILMWVTKSVHGEDFVKHYNSVYIIGKSS